VRADTYPTRAVRLFVGFTAGGPADIPARFVAERLSTSLGKPVVVENKPGAGSLIAMHEMLAQPRDGHSLLLCTVLDPINSILFRKAKYTVADIAPVGLIARFDYMLALRIDSPIASVADLLAYGKANPGKLNYGQLGIGSPQTLMAKKLEKLTGVKMTGVPFKGTADALREVAGRQIDMYMGPPISVMPLSEAKQVKVVAVTGPERLKSMPDVPTLTEAGVPILVESWFGICAGAGTPASVVTTLNEKLRSVVETVDYRKLIEASGSVPMSTGAAELQALFERNVADLGPTIREFNLQMD